MLVRVTDERQLESNTRGKIKIAYKKNWCSLALDGHKEQ